MDLNEWALSTQIANNVITSATAIAAVIVAYWTLVRTPQQTDTTAEPQAKNAQGELTELVVFKTTTQKTTLKIVPNGLECYLDNARSGRGGLKWTMNGEEIRTILDTRAVLVNPGFNANAGSFSIGRRRNWLYSKELFPDPEYLRGALFELLRTALSDQRLAD
jgi:hypothetical protein